MPYLPSKPPPTSSDDGTALAFYLEDELSRLAMSLLDDVQAVEVRPAHAAPLRPREGMLVYADGTDWNPGSGEGLYSYGSDAAWHLAGSDSTAWTSYTPTITSSVGTITTVAATGRYRQIGKTIFVNVTISITTVGTGAGQLLVPLPVTARATNNQALAATESVASGAAAKCEILASAPTRATVVKYDASTYIIAGAVISISGVYEAA